MDVDDIIADIRGLVQLHEDGFMTHWELFDGLRKLSSKACTEPPKKGELDPNTGLRF
jgi:hypothetical protein